MPKPEILDSMIKEVTKKEPATCASYGIELCMLTVVVVYDYKRNKAM